MNAKLLRADGEAAGSGARRRHLLIALVRLIIPFWKTRSSRRSWVLLSLIGLGILAQAQLTYLSNTQLSVFTNVIVGKDLVAFLPAMLKLVATGFCALLIIVAQSYLQLWIEIDWRVWLTQHFADRWLANDCYYRIERDARADNPDQRISDDVHLFIELTGQLGLDLVGSVSNAVVYGIILWTIGGPMIINLHGVDYTLPGGIFWVTWIVLIVFFGLLAIVAQPLIRLTVAQQRKEADFRFSMASLRMNAEQIALYGGAVAEATRLDGLFAKIVANWRHIMWATVAVALLNGFYQSGVVIGANFPGYDRYLRGEIDYGQLGQIGGAVGAIAGLLIWFVLQMQEGVFFTWAAAVRRLDAFSVELSHPDPSGILVSGAIGEMETPLLETRALALAQPDGRALATPGNIEFRAGERWLVQGDSGAGKSTMMRAMAGLWPHGQGTVRFNSAARERTLFLPQKSYVPAGPLVDAICYPAPAGAFPREACVNALRLVRLDGLVDRLDEDARWQERLSPGEQQRLAFARVFLHCPEIILLDEATSALDPDNESRLYSLLNDRLPDALVISIAHRDSLTKFHDHNIRLDRCLA